MMPEGVEHSLILQFKVSTSLDVSLPMMPKGVEHPAALST